MRENLQVPADVRVWNEHESPFALLADWLKTHGAGKGPVGVEETTRFFAFDGLRSSASKRVAIPVSCVRVASSNRQQRSR